MDDLPVLSSRLSRYASLLFGISRGDFGITLPRAQCDLIESLSHELMIISARMDEISDGIFIDEDEEEVSFYDSPDVFY